MSTDSRSDQIRRTLDAIWRIESPRLIAALVRVVGDIGLAEDVAQDALEAALRQWPGSGIPVNPAAWLTAVAKRRAIDKLRREATLQRKAAALGANLTLTEPDRDTIETAIDNDAIGDDLLRLVFICCHPVLSVESRVALTLRLVGGLRTDEIARVPFEVPHGVDLEARLGAVLAVIYLIFNEGYSATSGDDWVRPALCEEALRLGRVLAALVPDEPESHGLVALMEIQASRLRARTDPRSGAPVPLLEQRRSSWDGLLIRRGLDALARADALPGPSGPYALQAAIAACHARARSVDETDWHAIIALYDALVAFTSASKRRARRADRSAGRAGCG